MDHFIAISELQSGNAQIWAKFVLTSLTYSVDLSPWLLQGPFVSRLSMVITHEQMDGRTDEVFVDLLSKNLHFESDFSLILYNKLNVGVYVDSCSVADSKQVFPCSIADSIHWCTKVPNVSVKYCKTSTLVRKKTYPIDFKRDHAVGGQETDTSGKNKISFYSASYDTEMLNRYIRLHQHLCSPSKLPFQQRGN